MRQFAFGTYNLETGGLDEGQDTRLERQLAMLAQADADGWALQECNGWAGHGGYSYLHFAEHMLGMRGFLARSGHHGCDVAVLVRQSPEITVNAARHEEGAPYWHAVAAVEVVIDDDVYTLASAHLAPSSPALRQAEAEAFNLTGRGAPLIAGGDWNAVPANDPDPDTTGTDPATARRKLDRGAARALEETGLHDVAACLGNLAPTVGHHGGLSYRCDRIYTSLPRAAITGYRVITGPEPDSDHLPAVATFDLDAG